MDPEIFYAVVDGNLQRVETHRNLPTAFLNAVPTNVDAILDTRALTIGGWEDITDGPLVLSLDAAGELTAIIAVNADQFELLTDTLQSIDNWLGSMRLRDLSELSGNPIVFYEGLLDLSPDSTIALAPTRHYVLLTALDDLSTEQWSGLLPHARFSVRYFDAVVAPGHPALVRRRPALPHQEPASPPPLAAVPTPEPAPLEIVADEPEPLRPHLESVQDPAPTAPVVDFSPVEIPRIDIVPPAPMPNDIAPLEPIVIDAPVQESPVAEFTVAADAVTAEGDYEVFDLNMPAMSEPDPVDVDAEVIDLIAADANSTIDLDDPLVNGLVDDLENAIGSAPPIAPGTTYFLNELPLLFDPTGESLISISDELFAVDDDIILVVKLPDRRRNTPFEERDRFRWDTSLDRIQLLNDYGNNRSGQRRTMHLFVESDRQSEYATYVGLLNRTAFQTQTGTEAETAWFSIEPRLDGDLHRLFKRGRLPQYEAPADSPLR